LDTFVNEQLFFNKHNSINSEFRSLPSFTKRELQIIRLVTDGDKNKEIGIKLIISEKTVKHHISKIFKKLHISKRSQLKSIL